MAFRVLGSTRASTATMRAGIGVLSFAAYTATLSPTLSPAATRCATVKSTWTASATPWRVVSSAPSFRYWPMWTSAMPTRARNGARMIFLAMSARVRAICAWATSCWARA